MKFFRKIRYWFALGHWARKCPVYNEGLMVVWDLARPVPNDFGLTKVDFER